MSNKLNKKSPITYSTNSNDSFNFNWKYSGDTNAWGNGGKRGSIDGIDIKDINLDGINSKYGNAGKLQTFLNNLGYNIAIDGYAGKQTKAALADYFKREAAKLDAINTAQSPEINPLNLEETPGIRLYTNNNNTLNSEYLFNTKDLKKSKIFNFSDLAKLYGDNSTNLGKAFTEFINNNEEELLEAGNLNQKNIESKLGIEGNYYKKDRNNILSKITENLSKVDNESKSFKDFNDVNTLMYALLGKSEIPGEDLSNVNNYTWIGNENNKKLYFKHKDDYYTLDDNNQIKKVQKLYNYNPQTLSYNISYIKNGGTMNTINKFLQGGQTLQLELQIVQLVQAAMQGDGQADRQIQQIMQAAEKGDQQATLLAQMIKIVLLQIQKQQQSPQKAKQGAKLTYLNKLKNNCPEGEELVFLKQGGHICPVCLQRRVQEEKCGGKVKKHCGGGITPAVKAIKAHLTGGKASTKKG